MEKFGSNANPRLEIKFYHKVRRWTRSTFTKGHEGKIKKKIISKIYFVLLCVNL